MEDGAPMVGPRSLERVLFTERPKVLLLKQPPTFNRTKISPPRPTHSNYGKLGRQPLRLARRGPGNIHTACHCCWL